MYKVPVLIGSLKSKASKLIYISSPRQYIVMSYLSKVLLTDLPGPIEPGLITMSFLFYYPMSLNGSHLGWGLGGRLRNLTLV